MDKILNTQQVILIVSPPGDLQIGLQALLTTHLDVDVIVVGAASSAVKVMQHQKPTVVILDDNLPGGIARKIIQDINTNWSETICIVLVNDEQGRQSFWDTGANFVAIKGLPGAKLVAEIKRLLDVEEIEPKEKPNE